MMPDLWMSWGNQRKMPTVGALEDGPESPELAPRELRAYHLDFSVEISRSTARNQSTVD
jgi:hypothetical protein